MTSHLLAYLLNAGWQLTLIAAVAWIVSRVLKPAPAEGSRLWLAAYGLAVLAPLAAMGLGSAAMPGGGAALLSKLSLVRDVTVPNWLALTLAYIFWGCFAVASLRLLAASIAAWRFMAQSSELHLSDELVQTLTVFCANRGHALPRIRGCARVSSPLVTGLWRPCILVPPGVAEQGDGALRAALLHELAHVVRRDQATNIAVEILALPLTWHPGLHLLKAMIRLTREQSCDAMAAAQIGCRHMYADTLLSLARRAIAPRAQSVALGLFGDGDLPNRVAMLAASARPRLPRFAVAAVIGLFLMLGGVVTAVHLSPMLPVTVLPTIVRSQILPGLPPSRQVMIQTLARAEPRPLRPHRTHGSDRMVGLAEQKTPSQFDTVALGSPPESATSGGGDVLDFLLPLTSRYRTIAP